MTSNKLENKFQDLFKCYIENLRVCILIKKLLIFTHMTS